MYLKVTLMEWSQAWNDTWGIYLVSMFQYCMRTRWSVSESKGRSRGTEFGIILLIVNVGSHASCVVSNTKFFFLLPFSICLWLPSSRFCSLSLSYVAFSFLKLFKWRRKKKPVLVEVVVVVVFLLSEPRNELAATTTARQLGTTSSPCLWTQGAAESVSVCFRDQEEMRS